jgi:hypothetical protein
MPPAASAETPVAALEPIEVAGGNAPPSLPLAGKRRSVLEKLLLMPDQIHRAGRVFAVVDGEGGIEPYPFGMFSRKARADGVESSGPHVGS